MGWVSYYVEPKMRNGRRYIDRKEECDRYLTQEPYVDEDIGYVHKMRVLKSSMVGRTYYAAVENTYQDGSSEVWAAVILTSTSMREHYNFAYKAMDETMGPGESECPIGILKLLSNTDSEYALDWRKRCYAHYEGNRQPTALKNLPVGSRIRIKCKQHYTNGKGPGDEVLLTKRRLQGRKRAYWYDDHSKWPVRIIPNNYEVIGIR